MFIIDGAGNLLRIRRRPRDWEHRETEEDCRFIAENRRWDGDDRESVAKAIGLYDVMPNATSIATMSDGSSSLLFGTVTLSS
jgi:hypothetical protein